LNVLKTLIAATAILTASAGFACAHHHKAIVIAQAHQHHGATAATPSKSSAATKGYEAANAKMHKDMAIKFSGNADADFARGMIPHHQGAIDMAKVVLAHGKDPEIRKLAEEIIKAQESEIAWMREWLKKNAR